MRGITISSEKHLSDKKKKKVSNPDRLSLLDKNVYVPRGIPYYEEEFQIRAGAMLSIKRGIKGIGN